jgi:uncharacterized membrane protein
MKRVAKFFAGPVMMVAGINHFVNPAFYLRIMPQALPAAEALVYVSGVAEILGALGTMNRHTRRPAGWCLIATLVAVYPANIYMALNPSRFSSIPHWTLLARLPLQFLFVYWVWLATVGEKPPEDGNLPG